MAFDVEGARKAGYSDAEIVDHLAGERSFDAAGARKSGYTDAEILGHLREPLAPAGPDPNAPSRVGSMARGIVQGATFGLVDELRAGTDALVQGARNLAGGDGPSMGDAYDASLAQSRGVLRQDMATNPTGAVVGQVAGGVGTALATAPAAAAVGLTRLAAPVVGRLNALLPAWANTAARVTGGGAAGGAATGFGEGEGGLARRLDTAGEGALFGAGAGAVLHGAAGVANRLMNPVRSQLSPEAADLVDAARNAGIPLSVGQETGSRFLRNVEGAMAQLPGSAAGEQAFNEAQRRAFNRAVLARSGTGADIASPEVLGDARQRIGSVIDEVSNRNTLRVTPELEARLAEVEDSLRFLPAEAAGPVRARIEQVRGMMVQPPPPPGGNPPPGTLIDPSTTTPLERPLPTIPGASYRMLDSQIGRNIRSTTNGDLRGALNDIRQTLRRAMDDSISPEDAAAWQQARREYANLMVTANAAKGAGGAAAEGHVSPLALRQALDRSTGGGYVWGQGDLNELARVGQSVLRQPPDSGTAGRSMANSVLTGGAWSAPAGGIGGLIGGPVGVVAGAAAPFVLPRMAQEFMRSPAGRAYLLNGLGQIDPALVQAGSVAAGSATARNRLLQQD